MTANKQLNEWQTLVNADNNYEVCLLANEIYELIL